MSSVTLVHPAKAVGRNEMPFDRDTYVVSSNTVLDRGCRPPQEGEIWGFGPPGSQRCHLSPNYFGPCYYSLFCSVLLCLLLVVGIVGVGLNSLDLVLFTLQVAANEN